MTRLAWHLLITLTLLCPVAWSLTSREERRRAYREKQNQERAERSRSFPLPVAWHIDAPCAFVGFFSEALPILQALEELSVPLSLHLAEPCNSSVLEAHFDKAQAALIRRIQAPPDRHFRSLPARP